MYRNEVTLWVEDEELDYVYEFLRRKIIKHDHRNAANYNISHVNELSAKSIYWDEEGQPQIVASILQRDCWPQGLFRILNRAWRPFMNVENPFAIHHGWFQLIEHQRKWCLSHGARGVFISRQSFNIRTQRWISGKIDNALGLKFNTLPNKYLTCANEANVACWQRILYCGDIDALQSWKYK